MKSEAFFVLPDGQEAKGPYTYDQLMSMLTPGEVTPETLFAFDGAARWLPLAELIQVLPGEFLYHTKSATPRERLPAWVPLSACLLVRLNDENRTVLSVLDSLPDPLLKEIQPV